MKNRMEKIIDLMKKDLKHGSSWYFDKAIELLSEVEFEDLGRVYKELDSIRPMATLSNISEVIGKLHNKYELKMAIDHLKNYRQKSSKNIELFLRKLNIRSFVTISFSSAVLTLIKNAKPDLVYLMESRPGNEVGAAFREYSKHVDTRVIPDSSICSFIEKVDAVVIGADGIYGNGIVNKIGSACLVACGSMLGQPVYAIAESYKAGIECPPLSYEVKYACLKKTVKIPLFEKVNWEKVNYLVTDIGIYADPVPAMMTEIRGHFIHGMVDQR